MFVNLETILSVAIVIVPVMIVLVLIHHFVYVIPMRKRIDEQSRVIYSLLQKTQVSYDKIYDIEKNVSSNTGNITSLTSSIRNLIQENKARENEKILPVPQLSEMILRTIDEYIQMEITLMRDMRVPDKGAMKRIIDAVVRTYPHVDSEYIVRRVTARLEEIVRQ